MNLLPGVPPSGLGVYVWQSSGIPAGPWSYFVIDARMSSVIELAKARGPVWLFRTPEAWTPSTWRATLAALVAQAQRVGAAGIVANPEENGWDASVSAAERRAFGEALAEAARVVRVGVVSIPSWGPRAVVMAAAGPRVWWSIELYGRTTPPSSFGDWISRWSMGGASGRVVPSIAGFVPNTALGRQTISAEGFAGYLAAFDRSLPGAIVWPNAPLPAWMTAALADRYGSPLERALMAAAALRGALPVVLALFVFLALAAWKVLA